MPNSRIILYVALALAIIVTVLGFDLIDSDKDLHVLGWVGLYFTASTAAKLVN